MQSVGKKEDDMHKSLNANGDGCLQNALIPVNSLSANHRCFRIPKVKCMKDIYQDSFDRVEFRWRQHEGAFAHRLAEEARALGRSQSDHARELLKNSLSASDDLQKAIEALHQDVMEIRQQLRHLPAMKEGVRTVHDQFFSFRDSMATCVYRLLIELGHLSPKIAEQWIRDTFHSE
jgi:hypothetical protein